MSDGCGKCDNYWQQPRACQLTVAAEANSALGGIVLKHDPQTALAWPAMSFTESTYRQLLGTLDMLGLGRRMSATDVSHVVSSVPLHWAHPDLRRGLRGPEGIDSVGEQAISYAGDSIRAWNAIGTVGRRVARREKRRKGILAGEAGEMPGAFFISSRHFSPGTRPAWFGLSPRDNKLGAKIPLDHVQ